MADDQDKSQKTEEPTQKKLEDAREKGQVPSSREVTNWFMLSAAALMVAMVLPGMMGQLKGVFLKFIAAPHAIPINAGGVETTVRALIYDVSIIMAPPMLIMVVAALLSGVVQNGLIFAPDKLKPKLEKISIGAGIKRLFSLKSLVEFAKGVFKIAIVGTVATLLMMPQLASIEEVISYDSEEMLAFIHVLVLRLLIGVVAIITVIAVLDFVYQKYDHLKNMMMSRQDIKDEFKQTEGDPIIRQRLRQIRQERARNRMMAAVPDATVVITNPTHYAVALKYELDKMPAPVLLAKGADHIALKIRDIARENEIPIVENPPIARALYAGVEIDQEIPPEHYKAIAEIIGFVLGIGRRGR